MHLRSRAFFLLFLSGVARRGSRTYHFDHDAQQQSNTLANGVEASAEVQEASFPQGFGPRVARRRAPQAAALGQVSRLHGGHAGHREPLNRTAALGPRLPAWLGPRRDLPEEGQLQPKEEEDATAEAGDVDHDAAQSVAEELVDHIPGVDRKNMAAETPKRILYLIGDTGGGHRASANAIRQAIDHLRPDAEIESKIVDLWTEHGCWPFTNMPQMYAKMSSGGFIGRNLWRMMFYATPPFRKLVEWDTHLRCGARFRKLLEDYKPDLVVSLHPMTQHVPLRVMDNIAKRNGGHTVPFATVCTDLGSAYPAWFHKQVEACFVPSDVLHKRALATGVPPENIKQHGLPVREPFWTATKGANKPNKMQYKALGLRPDLKTVLVVGGGDGAGALEKIARALGEQLGKTLPKECQMVTICGKNAKLQGKLAKARWKDVAVHIVGFTSQMSEYMEVADVIVTKAGPGTIAEAAIRGLPTMLSGHLPGQEAGNVAYVVDSGFGEMQTRPKQLAARVAGWLGDASLLKKMRANAQHAARPDATHDIAEDLLNLMDKEPPPRPRTRKRPRPMTSVKATTGDILREYIDLE